MMKYNELSFQLMVDASPIALMLVNKHGKIVYLNRYTEKLFLYDKEEIIGKDIGILMNEKYRSKHPKLLSGYFENPTSRSMGLNRELYAQKKNGVEFPVEIGLNPIVTVDGTLALAAINDITDRKIAKEQFRLVVESAPNAMLLVDDLGKIVMVNRQTEILFKYKQNELINKKIEMLMPENLRTHHPDLRENFHSDPQARPMGIGRDLVALKKDGTEFPIEIGLNPIVKNDGNFVLASIIDITQRKKNEESFKSFAKQLETKNKQLEEYTNIASHDLREPLNSITVLIKLLVEDEKNKLDEETFETLNLISQSASRMNSLIIGLLDYARLGETPRVKSIDFNEMVDVVLQDLSSSIKASNAKIKVNKLPNLFAFDVEIRLLFQNIINNALKYKRPDIDPEITISARETYIGWEFSISDNGIGIPPDQKDKIFVLFQRLHARDEYEGIGIGLAHCRKIVELHDGEIWVESKLGKGSTFYFSIASKY